MQLIIDFLRISNFKGCSELELEFSSRKTDISGANATGKTTILDAIWWLLFNKDSQGKEKFEIRTLDENGEKIHNTDIVVEAGFHTADKEFTLKKTQRERWVTKRGTVTAELQGNDNIYEVDGFERKESDYREFIKSITGEDRFKILSNPTYFSSLPQKEQREMLMQLVSIPSDEELGKTLPLFECILPDLGKASTDEIMSKYRKEQAGKKEELKALPIRIDEVSRQKKPVNEELLRREKETLEGEVAELDKHLKSVDTSEQAKAIADEIYQLKQKQTEILRKSREDYETRRSELRMGLIKAQADANVLETKINEFNRSIERDEKFIASNEQMLTELRVEWETARSREYDGETTCPYCGQPLPEDKLDSLKSEFAKKLEKELASIKEKGVVISNEVNRLKENVENAKQNLMTALLKRDETQRVVATLQKQLDEIKEPEIPQECYQIDDEISAKETIAESLVHTDTEDYEIARDSLVSRIADIERELMQVEVNAEADKRIAELTEQQRTVAQESALIDQKIQALSVFVTCKMDRISENLNGKFKNVQFRLFRKLINGGIEPCCEATYDGVPYASLNSGHRILAGIEIIEAMQKANDVKVPVFIDNAESLSSFNLPKIDCQLITLTVSEDRELRIS